MTTVASFVSNKSECWNNSISFPVINADILGKTARKYCSRKKI